ncbi:hypothetical protein GMI70_01115 [Eggerthellaceae bacterium zg-893]|nr:hypothetical protein [Eggerthellaceae bacterium zg-893]
MEGRVGPIAVIGALEEEIDLVNAALCDRRTEWAGEYRFDFGTIAGADVVVAHSFMGMANSAAATALAVARFGAGAVLSIGTAGAHNPALHTGDIVLGSRTVNDNSHMTAHRDRGSGSDVGAWEVMGNEVGVCGSPELRTEFFCDAGMLAAAQAVPYGGGRLVVGTVASGDVWNKEIDRIDALHRGRGSDCEDMETFSVAQTCWQLGRVPWLGVRIVSNSEHFPDEVFDVSVAQKCQAFALDVIAALA